MRKFIKTTKAEREKLMAIFRCGEKTISNALNYNSARGYSEKTKRIRIAAREMGCLTYNVVLEMETIHDSEGKMTQVFPNGAVMELDKITGEGTLTFKGLTVLKVEGVDLKMVGRMQEAALTMR